MKPVLCIPATPACVARIAPVAAALATRGHRVTWSWEGADSDRAAAIAFGLPQDATPHAHERGSIAVLAHASERTLALAETLAAFGCCILRVDAGARTFAHDRAARELDRRADVLLCATSTQRDNLRRDGIAIARAIVIGCGLHATASAWPQTSERATVALLLSEGPDQDFIRNALSAVAHAHGLDVEEPKSLQQIAGARAVVTDRDDAQVVACAMRVPCVVAKAFTARSETVACGASRIAGDEPIAIARALEVALLSPRDWAQPYGTALDAEAIERAIAAAPATDPIELPSDGDFTGRALGAEECESVARAIRSGTLNSTKGTFVTAFERAFAQHAGRQHAIACTSGSTAVHCAIAALGLSPGDEVITTPITDMGALTCICYEGGVPVFADVDPRTMNVTAKTIAAQLTDRTRAIVVTHLFGLVCEMAPIQALARERGIPIIEDCAQAFGATSRDGRAGSFGAIACYSLQQGKHMTTGEGGIVATDDAQLARRMFLFVNKAWGYGDKQPDHYFPALNARMTELQGAVALPQLQKLPWVLARRRAIAASITAGLRAVRGIRLPNEPEGGTHSWWKYAFFVDAASIDGGAVALGARMKARGVFCAPRYVQKPAFECALFRDFTAHPVTRMPLEHNPRRDAAQPMFSRSDYPGAVEALESVVVLPIDELYEEKHIEHVCAVIRDEAKALSRA